MLLGTKFTLHLMKLLPVAKAGTVHLILLYCCDMLRAMGCLCVSMRRSSDCEKEIPLPAPGTSRVTGELAP